MGEVAGLPPGADTDSGREEAAAAPPAAYRRLIERVQTLVQACGKQMIGWGEIAPATLVPTTLVQHWRPAGSPAAAVRQGARAQPALGAPQGLIRAEDTAADGGNAESGARDTAKARE